MKKRFVWLLAIVSLFIITGCGKNERTMDYLLEKYVESYNKADIESLKELYPKFYVERSQDLLTKEKLESEINGLKDTYGDDFSFTCQIENSTKMTDDELKEHNERISATYNTKEVADECYKYEVNGTFKGSKQETLNMLMTMGYCRYNGTWYIINVQ